MPPLSIMVLGTEKELLKIEEVFDSVQRSVGGLRMFRASKSVDGVGQLQKAVATTGACHAAFLMDRFTSKGKEDFSDTLRKLLKDKFPKVPVVLWGDAAKGGKQGKDYHVTLSAPGGAANPAELTAMLKKIKAGEVAADYGEGDKKEKKGGKSKDGVTTPDRKSLDSPRPSIDSPRPVKKDDAAAAGDGAAAPARRVSMEGGAPPLLRRKSMEALASEPAADAAQIRRGSFDMARQGSGFARSSGGMSPMRSSGSMTSMGGLSPLAGLGVGRMPSMTGMSPMGGVAGGMSPMGINGGMMGGMMGGMAPMNGMMGMSPMGGGMIPMGGGGGMMPSMGALMTAGGSGSFADGGGGGLSAGMSGMALGGPNSPGGYDGGAAAAPVPDAANVELIKMLGAEVMRLQKLVEEKRLREQAYPTTTMV